MAMTYVKHESISLKNHPQFNESWLKARILEDPSILGLGNDLEVKDVERMQPKAGRLDLLLFDRENAKRYCVELMLGPVDESHIIRCIEYWDNERKRYGQYYDHAAVLVAEEITTRFLNVINLFNSAIPMIAIQLNALKHGDSVLLNFTKVLDEIIPGEDDEDDSGGGEPTDRNYWEQRSSKESVKIVDECLEIVRSIDPTLNLKYNKYYIGLADHSRVRNFVGFKAKRQFVRVEAKISDRQTWIQKLDEAGLVVLGAKYAGRVTFRLAKGDVQQNGGLLKELFEACNKEYLE